MAKRIPELPTSTSSRRRRAQGGAASSSERGRVILLLVLALLLFSVWTVPSPGPKVTAAVAIFGSSMAAIAVAWIRGVWAASTVLLFAIGLFHIPLAVFFFSANAPDLHGAPMGWFYLPVGEYALWTASLGMLAFACGALALSRRDPGVKQVSTFDSSRVGDPSKLRGDVVVALAVVAWLVYTISALGPGFFLMPYRTYLDATASAPFPYVFYAMSIGLGLVAASGDPKVRRRGLLAFGAFALVAFPIGLRGEVLFPVAVYAIVAARHREMPSLLRGAVIALAVLSAVSFVQDLRQTGWGEYERVDVSVSPLSGLAELGYSLRTVAEVKEWHETGTPPREGATYIAPVERLLSRVGLAPPVPPAVQDYRLMNVEMATRAGNLGGSVIAEAYRNFETRGVVAILFFVGLLVSLAERAPRKVWGELLLTALMTALLQHVRNSFTPLPLQLGIGGTLVLVAVMLARRRTRGREAQRQGRKQ